MYARCPHCETVFTISAAHLRAALGHVQCGRCARVFDALPYLVDSPDEIPDEIPDEVLHEIANEIAQEIAPHPAPADSDAQWSLAERLATEQESRATGDASLDDTERRAGAASDPPARARSSSSGAPADDVPAVLLEDLARPAPSAGSRWRGVAALGIAVALLLALALQYAWFAPSDLVSRYPQASRLVEGLCALTGCDLGEGSAPGSIRVISRTVRVHPRYEGALRVRAVIVNTAPRAQPYPRVRFTLFNVNGETIGSRVFAPHEYLGAPPPDGEQLPARTPLQIALELMAPEDVAVSYEFKFL